MSYVITFDTWESLNYELVMHNAPLVRSISSHIYPLLATLAEILWQKLLRGFFCKRSILDVLLTKKSFFFGGGGLSKKSVFQKKNLKDHKISANDACCIFKRHLKFLGDLFIIKTTYVGQKKVRKT